jgi:hypothetical protein
VDNVIFPLDRSIFDPAATSIAVKAIGVIGTVRVGYINVVVLISSRIVLIFLPMPGMFEELS